MGGQHVGILGRDHPLEHAVEAGTLEHVDGVDAGRRVGDDRQPRALEALHGLEQFARAWTELHQVTLAVDDAEGVANIEEEDGDLLMRGSRFLLSPIELAAADGREPLGGLAQRVRRIEEERLPPAPSAPGCTCTARATRCCVPAAFAAASTPRSSKVRCATWPHKMNTM